MTFAPSNRLGYIGGAVGYGIVFAATFGWTGSLLTSFSVANIAVSIWFVMLAAITLAEINRRWR